MIGIRVKIEPITKKMFAYEYTAMIVTLSLKDLAFPFTSSKNRRMKGIKQAKAKIIPKEEGTTEKSNSYSSLASDLMYLDMLMIIQRQKAQVTLIHNGLNRSGSSLMYLATSLNLIVFMSLLKISV